MRRQRALQVAAAALIVGAVGSAEAFVSRPPVGLGLEPTPAAMCGRTCRNGGRYIPGPPSVCAEEGLNYCGSSRGGGYRERDYEDRDGPRGVRGRQYGFDEQEYLRCNPDVRR